MRAITGRYLTPLVIAFVLGGCLSVFEGKAFLADQPLGSFFVYPLVLLVSYPSTALLSGFFQGLQRNGLVLWAIAGAMLGSAFGLCVSYISLAILSTGVVVSFTLASVIGGIVFYLLAEWQPNSTPHPDAREASRQDEPSRTRAGGRGR